MFQYFSTPPCIFISVVHVCNIPHQVNSKPDHREFTASTASRNATTIIARSLFPLSIYLEVATDKYSVGRGKNDSYLENVTLSSCSFRVATYSDIKKEYKSCFGGSHWVVDCGVVGGGAC